MIWHSCRVIRRRVSEGRDGWDVPWDGWDAGTSRRGGRAADLGAETTSAAEAASIVRLVLQAGSNGMRVVLPANLVRSTLDELLRRRR